MRDWYRLDPCSAGKGFVLGSTVGFVLMRVQMTIRWIDLNLNEGR